MTWKPPDTPWSRTGTCSLAAATRAARLRKRAAPMPHTYASLCAASAWPWPWASTSVPGSAARRISGPPPALQPFL